MEYKDAVDIVSEVIDEVCPIDGVSSYQYADLVLKTAGMILLSDAVNNLSNSVKSIVEGTIAVQGIPEELSNLASAVSEICLSGELSINSERSELL